MKGRSSFQLLVRFAFRSLLISRALVVIFIVMVIVRVCREFRYDLSRLLARSQKKRSSVTLPKFIVQVPRRIISGPSLEAKRFPSTLCFALVVRQSLAENGHECVRGSPGRFVRLTREHRIRLKDPNARVHLQRSSSVCNGSARQATVNESHLVSSLDVFVLI